MLILGIPCFYHDSAATLVRDGQNEREGILDISLILPSG